MRYWLPLALAMVTAPTPAAGTAATPDAAATVAPRAGKVLVIAHRGASAALPEHTLAAYLRAIEDGADYIEPDLVSTRDGVLVARHENEIGGTTDVAAHPAFAERKTTRSVDGHRIEGWFVEDFSFEELRTLRARERLPQLRGTADDGLHPVPSFAEIIEVVPVDADGRLGNATTLVADAHAAGLQVMPYTFRPENRFLPRSLWQGDDPRSRSEAGAVAHIRALLDAGIDGFFTDDVRVGRRAVDGISRPAAPRSPAPARSRASPRHRG